ncbi:MAG: hypothetical protein RLZZ200_1985 [Pseudomonadota bacterium]|jgi:predicted metalloprotease
MRPALKLTLAGAAALTIALAVAVVLKGDPRQGLSPEAPPRAETAATPPAPPEPEPPPAPPPRDALDEFTSMLLAEAEDTWTPVFAEDGDTYIPPRLQFFTGTTRSGCGNAVEGDGTFYCASDRRLYIDKDFHHGLEERGAAEGSFAQAYVIAHSIAHHVQNLLGIEERLRREEARLGPAGRKALRVRAELQADCFAGIWAQHARREAPAIKPAELDLALTLPATIAVELAKRHEPGVIVPETFAHGTLAQRRQWFKTGFKRGIAKACNTYEQPRLAPVPALAPAPAPATDPAL